MVDLLIFSSDFNEILSLNNIIHTNIVVTMKYYVNIMFATSMSMLITFTINSIFYDMRANYSIIQEIKDYMDGVMLIKTCSFQDGFSKYLSKTNFLYNK